MGCDATAFAFKAGPPEGHRTTKLLATIPEWRLSSGHAHPDAGSFIIWARGRYLTGDTGYAGQPQARHHNTITVGGQGQGDEGAHDVWAKMDQAALDTVRITSVKPIAGGLRIEADAAGAYLPSSGLTRFFRTFEMTGDNTFSVTDAIETRTPKAIQWFLHADVPIEQRAGQYLLGRRAIAAGRHGAGAGRGSQIKTAATVLTAPGRPGAITTGPQENRGHHLVLETPAATNTTVRATLIVGGR